MAHRVRARLTAREGRRFAFTVGVAFLVLAGIATWRGKLMSAAGLSALAVALLGAGVLVPTSLGPVQRAWMGVAHALSKVTTPIVLAVIYFLVIAPAGLVLRLFRKKPPRTSSTYWVTRERKATTADQMLQQY